MRPAGAAALVLVALGWVQVAAQPRNEVRLATLPGWAREAMTLPLPATEADAVVALEELVVAPLPEGGVRETRRRAAMVLKGSGLARLGEDVAFYRRDDRILFHRVWTVSPEGVARVSDEEEDVVDVPAVPGQTGYSDARVRIVRVPGLRVGGWILSESSIVQALDLGAASHLFGDPEIPVVRSRVVLETPPGWSRAWVARRAPGLEEAVEEHRASFTLRDLAPAVRERDGPVLRDLLPAVWVRWYGSDGGRGFRTWSEVARWAGDLSEPALETMGTAAARAEALRPVDEGALLPAVRSAFDHAARDVRYVSIQLGIGGYRPEVPAQVEASRYGDCKAKATLLRALVQSWGLKTYSVIVATQSHGEVDSEIPTPRQFDHMIAAVALPDEVAVAPWPTMEVPGIGRLLFLDPTDSQGDAFELREDVQGTTALLVHPATPQLVRLPVQPAAAAGERRALRGAVDATGAFAAGRVEDRYTGTRASDVRRFYAGASRQEHRDAVARAVQDTIPGTTLADYRIEGLDAFAGPVRETLDLRGGRVGRKVGNLLVLEPGRLAPAPFEALPAPPRRFPLRAGPPRVLEAEIVLEIADGLVPEDLPSPASLDTPAVRGEAAWTFEGNRLVYRRSATITGGTVPPQAYPAFREAVRTVQDWDARGVVLVPRVP